MRIDNRPAFAMAELTGGYTEEKQEETPAGQDELLQQVEADKQAALNEVDQTYDGMIDQVDGFYQDQIDASKQWAQTQQQNQQAQTDFTIEQIEQEKQQAEKDYLKEQSGAYVDWQKQSGQYGVNAEAMAARGMGGTGYSESAQVGMYNTYQIRVATAREAIDRATLNYNNAIKEAKLQNNAVLAEIAYQAYQQELELALAGFQHKNQLGLEKADRKAAVERQYNSQYLDVLDQINAEDEEQNGVPIDDEAPEVQTEYYSGEMNADAKIYGTFSNGYQPKGISGHGKLKKTGDTWELKTQVIYGPYAGKTQTLVQNVWKAEDGTLWYWEGRDNEYKQIT